MNLIFFWVTKIHVKSFRSPFDSLIPTEDLKGTEEVSGGGVT